MTAVIALLLLCSCLIHPPSISADDPLSSLSHNGFLPTSKPAKPHYAISSYQWFFLHYHKTGHDLLEHMVQPVASKCHVRSTFKVFGHPLEAHFAVNRFPSLLYNIIRLSNLDTFKPWQKLFPLPHARIIHMVRNPFDMIISGYLFHAQDPTPEKFALLPNFPLCDAPATLRDIAIDTLRLQSLHNVSLAMDRAYAACLRLRQGHENASFYEYLRPDLYDTDHTLLPHNATERTPLDIDRQYTGVRVTAARALFAAGAAEMLRMAINVLQEDAEISRRFYTEQFPVNDSILARKNIQDMFMFLTHNYSVDGFWSPCFATIEDLVEAVFRHAFVDSFRNNSIEQRHVTKDRVDGDTRQELMRRLRRDEDFGLLLAIIEAIVMTTLPPSHAEGPGPRPNR